MNWLRGMGVGGKVVDRVGRGGADVRDERRDISGGGRGVSGCGGGQEW